jgi:hypothetical protein
MDALALPTHYVVMFFMQRMHKNGSGTLISREFIISIKTVQIWNYKSIS